MKMPPTGRERSRSRLAFRSERQLAVILAVAGEHVEGIELRLLLVLMQRGEVREAARIEHDCLAVDDEMALPQLRRSLDDPREARRPVVAAGADQPHAVLLPDQHHPVAVVLHFVEPVGAGRHLVRVGGIENS